MPPLLTSRLILRPWRDADRNAFARLCADAAVMQHLLPVSGRAASDALARRLSDHIDRYGFGFWAVEQRNGAAFIGCIGLMHVGFDAPFTPAVEIGWRLDPALWGQGYATEAAAVALDDGFGRLGLDEIVAFTVPANLPSQRVMQRLGMRRDPEGDFDHPRVPVGHRLRRHLLYRLRRGAWRAP